MSRDEIMQQMRDDWDKWWGEYRELGCPGDDFYLWLIERAEDNYHRLTKVQ